MTVLDRWGKRRAGQPDVIVFVTRNVDDHEMLGMYGEIEDTIRAARQIPLVIPCDEMGVCPEYRSELEGIHGLPAYFFGIRVWLRHHLTLRYGCLPAHASALLGVELSFERVEIAEEKARTAVEMLRRAESAFADLPGAEQGLSSLRAHAAAAQAAFEQALRGYHDSWLSSLRLRREPRGDAR